MNDNIAELFRKAIQLDSQGQQKVLAALPDDDRQQLAMLLDADLEAEDSGLLESLQERPESPESTSLVNKRIRDYELLEVIGEGGMGTVYRARHLRLKCDVALKILPIEKIRREDTIARFEREMAAVGQLRHPNIVQAMDAGEEQGLHYLVLEFIDGTDVASISKTVGQLKIADACNIIHETALGLQHAHSRGLIHRDIKPSNLLVSNDGEVKVADMGLAMLQQSGGSHLTSAGQIMGTLDYIAPEQIDDPRHVDPRADLYSLGCTFYQLLTGRAPFASPEFEGSLAKLRAHDQATPTAIGQQRQAVPEEVVDIIDRLLQKSPDNRIQSSEELAKLVHPFAKNANVASLVQRSRGANYTVIPTERMDGPADATDDVTANIGLVSQHVDQSDATALEPVDQASRTTSPESKPGRSTHRTAKRTLIGFIAIGLVAAMAFAIQQRFKVETPAGTLIVETAGKETAVTITGKSVTFADPSDGKPVLVTVDEERKLLVFTKDGFKAVSKSIDLESEDGHKISLSFEPRPATTESGVPKIAMTPRDVLASAFSKGAFTFSANYPFTEVNSPNAIPQQVSSVFHVAIRNSQLQRTTELLRELSEVVDLSSVSIHSRSPMDEETLDALASMPKLKELRVYAPWPHELLGRTDGARFSALERIGLFDESPGHSVDDEAVRLLVRQFPEVRMLELESKEITGAAIQSLAGSKITELKLIDPINAVLAELPAADLIQTLKLYTSQSIPAVDLPPGINQFFCDGTTLTSEHFAKLKECKSLKIIVQRLAAVDQAAVAEFRKARPDCVFEAQYVPTPATQSAPQMQTLAAIAAFDNQKGFSYVFYNDGTYEKLINGQDKLVHRLATRRFWAHLVGNRGDRLSAAFAQDATTSFTFYSDEWSSTYLNGPDLGLRTERTVETWSGPIATKAGQITAALRWPDGSRHVFFADGTCTQLTDDMRSTELFQTETEFPTLKGLSTQLSAARVDPATQLAYFYFTDGTVQVTDTLDNQILSTHEVATSNWRIPEHFVARTADYARPERSTQKELVEWAFENGLMRVRFKEGEPGWQGIREAKDFTPVLLGRTRQMLYTIELNADAGYARQILFGFSRYFSPQEIRVFGQRPVSDEVLAWCSSEQLRYLCFCCPMSAAQLSKVPGTQQVTDLTLASPSVRNEAERRELVSLIASRFTSVKALTIDAEALTGETLEELHPMELQRIVLLDPSNALLSALDTLTSVTSIDLKFLANAPSDLVLSGLPRSITRILLSGPTLELTAKQFESLAKYEELVELNLSDAQVTDKDVAAFETARPGCRVLRD